jgi:hypothetical protein
MEHQLDIEIIKNFFKDRSVVVPDISRKEKIKLKFLETENSKNFKYFNELFNDNIDRVGIINYEESFLFSILYIFDDKFILFDDNYRNSLIKSFKFKFMDDLVAKKINLPKEFKMKRLKLITKYRNNTLDFDDFIYIIASFLEVNIFIFCYDTNKITVFYNNNKLNLYKNNIFLNKINNIYYPLNYANDNGKFFKYNSTIISSIINSDKLVAHNKILDISINNDELLDKYKNKDLQNIIIDVNDDSDCSDNEFTENSFNSEINYNELSEDLKFINNKYTKSESTNEYTIDSDISLDINIEFNDINYDIEKIKDYSNSKLKSLKKDEIIEYLIRLNYDKKSLKKKTKPLLLKDLTKEIEKLI